MEREAMSKRVGAAVVLVVLVAASLGAGQDTAPRTVCEARDDLRAAVDRLLDVDVIRDGTNALRAALEDLREALTAFTGVADERVDAAASELRAAIDDVPATIRETQGQSLVDRARAIADALALVVNRAGQLLQTVAPACP
jgi:hypothetical protein